MLLTWKRLLLLASIFFSLETGALSLTTSSPHLLTLSAIISDAEGHAQIQCLQFLHPFNTYPTVGSVLHLANVTNVTYVVLPPHSKEGLHKPPHVMFFILLSGLAHVTLPTENPHDGQELWITPDGNGLIVAADVEGVGHFTEYPGEGESVALQVPFMDGKLPEHRVLNQGACGMEELVEQLEM
ncbi:hypothetical protein K469DRAFT_717068 [Zopfia rhizophila CBS 207.26]|uniref:Cupin type-1 domain-containing protein n=1 Tax=Zopfia rhizophila CBS 207.26 TaxID=1314779 RepID=A0A6A6EK59_9PEZI|nr:hypothetical protein K469DRAFT_717068 [Zopfia rhizophila CBS 207.26]